MPRALITGITGQDGLYLAELLLAKGYEVFGLIRGQNNPKRDAGRGRSCPSVTLLTGDLTDLSSLIRACRASPSRTRSTTSAPSPSSPTRGRTPALTTDVTGMGVLNMLEAIAPVRRRRHRQGALLPGVQLGDVRQGAARCRSARRRSCGRARPYGVAKVYGHYMTINYRESYGMHASLRHPLQPRVAAPRARVRHPQGLQAVARDHARAAGRASRWATSTPSATGASPATTSRRCG